MKRHSLIVLVLILAGGLTTRAQVPAAPGGAADVDQWAQWRGPLASGVAPRGQPPVQWSEQQNVKWKVPIPGNGASTPIVWGDKVFLQAAILTDQKDAVPQVTDPKAPPPTTIPAGMAAMFAPASQNMHQFVLMCLERGTGKVLWQRVAKAAVPHERHHRDHGYASYSPITDGIVWSYRKHMPYVPSPLLYGQRLYACESNKAVLTCLDTRTGKPLYAAQKLEALEGVYSSPVGAAGQVYLVGRNGVAVVLKDADTLQILATNTLDDQFTASPAIVGKELLLRGHKHLYCLEQR